jgi:hypothetical protein
MMGKKYKSSGAAVSTRMHLVLDTEYEAKHQEK